MTQLRLLRFGAGDTVYNFPSQQYAFKTNFLNVVPRTNRLPGSDGGFDEYRGNRAPSEIGSIQASWWLIPKPGQRIDALKDEVALMVDKGEQRLYIQPYDSSLLERWCYARINNIDMGEAARDMPELRQKVSATWQIADPFWYNQGTESWSWGDGTVWGSGAPWGGNPQVIYATGLQTDVDLTVGGTATTLCRLVVTVPSGKSATNLTVRRIASGVIRDQIVRTGTLTDSDTYKINPRNNTVQLNGVDAFNNTFDFKHPDWLRLVPGANRLRILLANPTDEATISLYWYERYR